MPSVDELRNEIRRSVDRFERVESTGFTKESLAAICAALDYGVDRDHLPSKARMRAGIRWRCGLADDDDPENGERSFRKADLEAILATLREE